jgi:hypothetical protein
MARDLGLPYTHYLQELPRVEDGVEGLRMIEAAAHSHTEQGAWVSLADFRH